MKRILIVGATALALVGCASSSKTYGPDGKEAYSLNCSGLARTWGACLERAGDICGERGYNVISSSSDVGSIMAGAAGPNNAAISGGTSVSRSMVISCKS